ncbi:hypothetical protein [Piscinibacterium candidicorallinum]|uniref:LysR substrate binding domain-containing protein n=1 Tax=Piscinibacterium candidicorallinum TaxID=1793872 RepID=A0ABV7HC22_9BURK
MSASPSRDYRIHVASVNALEAEVIDGRLDLGVLQHEHALWIGPPFMRRAKPDGAAALQPPIPDHGQAAITTEEVD